MALNKQLIEEARLLFERAESVLIASHVGPDGDAVCSVLGLGLALEAKGKDVQMVLSDGVPEGFEHLEGVEKIKRSGKGKSDLVVGVDCGDQERLGTSLAAQDGVDINIDHHVTNTNYGKLNLVDDDSVAACAMLAEHLEALGLAFSPAVVDALLTGMLTDTLGFRTSNMTPHALRIAADLLERGANIQVLYERALMRRSFEAMRYWGSGLVKLEREGKLLWSTLTREDRKASGYVKSDDAELINSLAATEGAGITVLFIEQDDKKHVKVSWRSRGGYDVATLAASFGGGGHRAASGASVDGTLEEVQKRILDASRAVLNGSKG